MVFFVLSGFLISASVIKRHFLNTWSWYDYILDRSSRLYVVLIPGLLLGLLWDKSGSSLFGSTGLYSGPFVSLGLVNVQNQLSPKVFLGNLFFLQTIVCPTFGSNGPLWSLANEFWYYVLFPVSLSAGLAWAKGRFGTATFFSLIALSLAVFLPTEISTAFFIWLSGCALVLTYSKFRLMNKTWRAAYLVIASSILIACLGSARTGHSERAGSDYAVALAFALFLFGILQVDFGKPQSSYVRVGHWVAGFSYTLYVVHFPFVFFLRAWLAPTCRWQPDVTHLSYGLILGVAVLAFAWFISLFTENQTRQARQLVKRITERFGGIRSQFRLD